jgi:PAS domain S-box-containing protein
MDALGMAVFVTSGVIISLLAEVTHRAWARASEAETQAKVATERGQAAEALQESEERLRLASNAAKMGVFEWDATHDHTVWENDQMYEIFGHTRDDGTLSMAELLANYVHPADAAAFEQALGDAAQTGQPFGTVCRIRRKSDGEWRWIEMGGRLDLADDGTMLRLVGVLRDITDHQQAQDVVRIRLKLLEFAVSHSLEELLQKTLDEVGVLTGSPIGFYHFVEDDQETISLRAWSTRTLEEFCRAEGKGLHYPVSQAGVWADCIRERRPVIHNDYVELPHRKGMPEGHATVIRELVVPIMRSNRVVAILGIGNKSSDYTQEDVELVSYLADVAWETALRKKTEEERIGALTLAERRNAETEAVLSAIQDAVLIYDTDMNVVRVNPMFSPTYGFDPVGLNLRDIIQLTQCRWLDGRPFRLKDQPTPRALHGEMVRNQHFRITRPDGVEMALEASSGPLFVGARTVGTVTVWHDITERVQAEEILRQSQERLAVIVDSIADGFYAIDRDWRFTHINDAALRHFGQTREQILGHTIKEVFPRFPASVFEREFQRAWELGEPVRIQAPSVVVDRIVELWVYPAQNTLTVLFRDVTDKVRLEQKLMESEERMRLAQSAAGIGIWEWSPDSLSLEWTPELEALYGIEPGTIRTYEGWSKLVHPDDLAHMETQRDQAVAERRSFDLEFRIRHTSGQTRWLHARGGATYHDDGRVNRVFGINIDITERKRLEEELRTSREDLNRAQAVAQVGSWRLNVQRNELLWSEENHRIFGVAQGTPMTYETFLGTVHPDDREYVHEKWSAGLRGEPYDIEHRLLVGDTVKWVREKAELEFDHAGVLLGGFGTTQDITERKHAEQALRQSEEEFRSIFDVSTVGLAQGEPLSGRFVRVNRKFCEITGHSADELLSLTFLDITHPEDRDRDAGNFREALEGPQGSWETEKRYLRKDGETVWVHVSGTITRDANGRPYRSSAGILDITARKHAEEALVESESRFRLLSETASELLLSTDPQAIVHELCRKVMDHLDCQAFFNFLVNEQAGKLRLNACCGIPEEEAHKIEWLDYGVAVCGCVAQEGVRIVAEDICHVTDVRTDLVKSYGIQAYACHPLMAEDRVIGTLSFGTKTRPHFSSQDLAFMKTVTDQVAVAMERKRLMEELQESRDQLEIRVRDRTNELAVTNRALEAEVLERRKFERSLQESEENLRRNNELLQKILDGITDPLVMLDGEGLVKMTNKAALEYYGALPGHDILGKRCYEGLRRRETACPGCEYPFPSLRSQTVSYERKGLGDSRRIENVTLYPVLDESGQRDSVIVKISDVTKAKVLERQLLQNEKLASLGLLTSGIAHEINNPNSFVAFNIPILRKYLEELLKIVDRYAAVHPEYELFNMSYPELREDIFALLTNMEHGAQRISRIVGVLKGFVRRKDSGEIHDINLKELIGKVVTLCRPEMKRRVKTFEVLIPEDLPPLVTDPEALEQILLNLLINASQACDKQDSQVTLKVEHGRGHGDDFVIEVTDNGSGIDESLRDRIFDPFFTTKPSTMGTGLGLYICHDRVQALGGDLEVESTVGQGSTFRIVIPRKDRIT